MRSTLVVLLATAGIVLLSACSEQSTDSDVSLSDSCRDAASTAVEAERVLYEDHPYYSAEIPSADASEEEWQAYDELQADEEAQWVASQTPVYESCDSVEEWLAAAEEFPLLAGVTGAEYVDTGMLELWCEENPEAPACTGLPEWIELNGSAYE
ncbi:MAG: hypothetical protein ACTHZ9_03375 [Leucobacter sp.]